MRPSFAHIHLDHLRYNYRLLTERAGDAAIMAVVKANAYGHGLKDVALTLLDEGCRSFAVTDAEEGRILRNFLQHDTADIILLSGIFDLPDAELSQEHQLTPVITETKQVQYLQAAEFDGAVWIKIDTGMQRLGTTHPEQLITQCSDANIKVVGIMSHLACADEPDHPLNKIQTDEFSRLYHQLKPESASLLNSAGLISLPHATYDFIRPGIALYGVEPVISQPIGLKPVMQLQAQVMQVRDVPAGTEISYGATFVTPNDMNIATVCLGYGDGLPRKLSNQGKAIHNDSVYNIVGRVCMDYCLIDCTEKPLKSGDMIEFWGENIKASDVASQTGTIAYELFTGITPRVQRKHSR
ncbi:MAG: alanine racemase [Mariprofundaceae bacterium]